MIYTQKSAEGSGRMTGDMSNTVDVNNKSRIERGGGWRSQTTESRTQEGGQMTGPKVRAG